MTSPCLAAAARHFSAHFSISVKRLWYCRRRGAKEERHVRWTRCVRCFFRRMQWCYETDHKRSRNPLMIDTEHPNDGRNSHASATVCSCQLELYPQTTKGRSCHPNQRWWQDCCLMLTMPLLNVSVQSRTKRVGIAVGMMLWFVNGEIEMRRRLVGSCPVCRLCRSNFFRFLNYDNAGTACQMNFVKDKRNRFVMNILGSLGWT